MVRFVAIAATLRGKIDPPEPLNDADQFAAAEQLRLDRSVEDCRVVYARRPALPVRKWPLQVSGESSDRVRRMMELARRAG